MNDDLFMKKQVNANRTLGLSLLSLGLFALFLWGSCMLLSQLAAVIGAVLLFLSGLVMQFRKKKREFYSFIALILNSIANGLITSVYYRHYSIAVDRGTVLTCLLLPAVLLLCAYILLGLLPEKGPWPTLLLILANAALMIGSVVAWILIGGVLYSFTFFCTVFTLIYTFVFRFLLRHPEDSVMEVLSIGSYGIMGIIVIVVIILVTDGEVFDGVIEGICDMFADLLPSRSQKRKTPKPL